jgi:hypothetical protein
VRFILGPHFVGISEHDRNPDLRLFRIQGKLESARHDPDHGVRIAIQPHRFAQDVLIRTETVPPDRVTQQNCVGVLFAEVIPV